MDKKKEGVDWETLTWVIIIMVVLAFAANLIGDFKGYNRGYGAGVNDTVEVYLEYIEDFKEDTLLAVENATNQAYLTGYGQGISDTMDFLEQPIVLEEPQPIVLEEPVYQVQGWYVHDNGTWLEINDVEVMDLTGHMDHVVYGVSE